MRFSTPSFCGALALLLLAGCTPDKGDGDTVDCTAIDRDRDGFDACVDCDDGNPTINPDAIERCDEIDNDCDDLIDDADPDVNAALWYSDADGDGYGDGEAVSEEVCVLVGYVHDATDCDDTDSTINPDTVELCDGIDNDCDGVADNGLDTIMQYEDADGDGYGKSEVSVEVCFGTPGWVTAADDCDDADPFVYPGVEEICDGIDNDCDGLLMDAERDDDGDGLVEASDLENGGDCDDSDASIYLGAPEVPYDGIDQDCDGADLADADGDGFEAREMGGTDCIDGGGSPLDDDNPAGLDPAEVNPEAIEAWYDGTDQDCAGDSDYDQDLDGYDAEGYGYGSNDDCDDSLAYVHPDSGESAYTSYDDDCDGRTDDYDLDDMDGDGVSSDEDCDDTDRSAYPGAAEVCDGADNDCDGESDEDAADATAWYADADGDGFGDETGVFASCEAIAPVGYVDDATDCDDRDDDIYPGAPESCDGLDNDCDGAEDEAGAIDELEWYEDADGDGYGAALDAMTACDQPTGYVDDATDCDDSDSSANPGEIEVCDDGVDNDCDDGADETDCDGGGSDPVISWSAASASADEGDGTETVTATLSSASTGTITATFSVGGTATGGGADYSYTPTSITILAGATTATVKVTVVDDADDESDETVVLTIDSAIGATIGSIDTHVLTIVDNDEAEDTGSGDTGTGITDADGDGYYADDPDLALADCDDTDGSVYPGSPEVAIVSGALADLCSDGKDQDCDGLTDVDDWDCLDEDADGIANGADALVARDESGDGSDDTLCVVAIEGLVASEPFSAADAYIQGDATAWGGGFFSLGLTTARLVPLESYADSDGDGDEDVSAWCVTPGDYGLSTGNWNWRLVSELAADGMTSVAASCDTSSVSGTWQVASDLSVYCSATADLWCRIGLTTRDGCGTRLGNIMRAHYDASDSSVAYY